MNPIDRFARSRTPSQIHGTGVVVLVGGLILATVAGVPAWTSWSSRIQTNASLRAATARNQAARTRIESLRRQIAQLDDDAATRHETLPTLETLDRRLLTFSASASPCGVWIDSAEPGATSAATAGGPISINVAARGPYPALVTWLHQLHDVAPDLTLDTLQISNSSNGTCGCRATFNYWSPPVSTAAPATVLASTSDEGGAR